jgi:phosphoglycerate dehydrogenase-like enzyme
MTDKPFNIVFHGENAGAFYPGFTELLEPGCNVAVLPDRMESDEQREAYRAADIIIATRFSPSLPRPEALRLFLVPGAGYDAVDFAALPKSAAVCNCFGHEDAIAEYVMASILHRAIPLAAADHDLRQGKWTHWAGAAERAHGEISGRSIGLLGFGHIGQAVAKRAKAFGMQVNVANRSPVANSALVDRSFLLSELDSFWGSSQFIVVSLPLLDETRGVVNAAAFAAMRDDAVLINVGRGGVVDETALYEALRNQRIGGAVIDTWYNYPAPGTLEAAPGNLPFHMLENLLMTPHMSGWTEGTIRRRQAVMADNIARLRNGSEFVNIVRPVNL